MLHDRFAELVSAASQPVAAEVTEPMEVRVSDLSECPGIPVYRDHSTPLSEPDTLEDGIDEIFPLGVEPAQERKTLRRSLRIAT